MSAFSSFDFCLVGFNPGLTFMGVLLFFVSLFMILLVLVQRGKGGGLTGALGGAGGQSAFGSKAGDAFTKITIITAVIWITLCMLTIAIFNPPPRAARKEKDKTPASLPAPSDSTSGGMTGGADASSAPSDSDAGSASPGSDSSTPESNADSSSDSGADSSSDSGADSSADGEDGDNDFQLNLNPPENSDTTPPAGDGTDTPASNAEPSSDSDSNGE